MSFQEKVTVTLKPKKQGDRIYITENGSDPSLASSTRHEYTGETKLEIRDRKVIRYVAIDADGNCGIVQTLDLVNEAKKHEIAIQESFTKGAVATFSFPKDQNGFMAACRSLIKTGLNRNIISKDELVKVLKTLLEEISGS